MSDKASPPSGADAHGKSVVKGIGWNFIAVIGEQISTLVAFVLVARILGPSDFGIVVLSVALIDILITFVRAGISEALIRAPDMSPVMLATGFWLNMGLAIILAGSVYAFAPTFGSLVHVPETIPLLQAMTVAFPIAAAGAIAEATLARRMAFAAIARRQILGSLAGAIIAILLAFAGYGVWAMIFQRIVIFSIGAILAIWAARLAPQMRFSMAAAREIVHFGSGITSINILYRLQPRAAELVIGFLAQPVAVALYRAAYRLVDLVNQLPMQPVMRVTFPTLSRLTATPDRFRAVLKKFMEGLQTILLPVYAGIGYVSADIFHLLFGGKWDGAVPAFVLLLVAAGLRVTFVLLGPATSARGAVKITAAFSFIDVGISILLMIATASWGIEAIAGSRVIGAVLLWPVSYYMLMRPAGISLADVLATLKRPLAIAALLLAALFAFDHLLLYFGLTPHVIAKIAVCGLVYGSLVLAVSRDGVAELIVILGIKKTHRFMNVARKMRIVQ